MDGLVVIAIAQGVEDEVIQHKAQALVVAMKRQQGRSALHVEALGVRAEFFGEIVNQFNEVHMLFLDGDFSIRQAVGTQTLVQYVANDADVATDVVFGVRVLLGLLG